MNNITLSFTTDAGSNYVDTNDTLSSVTICDGQADDRQIPLTNENIEEFNKYVNTDDGSSKYYILTEDILLDDKVENNWTAIGNDENPFTGSFDGNGHTIENININEPDKDNQGMFGNVGGGGTVSDLTIENITVNGGNNTGGVVGNNNGGTVDNVTIDKGSVNGGSNTGGLVGSNTGTVEGGTIIGSVEGGNNTGGLVGSNTGTVEGGTINGNISGYDNTGGAVGNNNGDVSDCIVIGMVDGGDGIVGKNDGGTVEECAVLGDVSGTGNTGGVAGSNTDGGKVENCAVEGEISGGGSTGGLVGSNNGGTVTGGYISDKSIVNNENASTSNMAGSNTGNGQVSGETSGDDLLDVPNDALFISVFAPENTITPFDGENSADFTVKVSGFKDDSEAQNVGLEIAAITGLSFSTSNDNIVNDVKTFTVTVNYDGAAAFTNGTAEIGIDINNVPSGYKNLGEQMVTVTVRDGQTVDEHRILHVNSGNVKAFNKYAKAGNGLTRHYALTENVTLESPASGASNWTTIGDGSNKFAGSFNGRGYTIRNLTINANGADRQGMFCAIGGSGEIKNLGLLNASVTGGTYVGGIVGANDNMVQNCYVTGNVSGSGSVGGVAGYSYGTVKDSYSTCGVTGTGNNIGGMVGDNYGMVDSCYATGSVKSTGGSNVGGVVGYNVKDAYNSAGTIKNCHATGNTSGSGCVGGVVGKSISGIVQNSYAKVNVTGTGGDVGGVAGQNTDSGTLRNCYALGDVKGGAWSGGAVGTNLNGSLVEYCYATGSVFIRGDVVGGVVGSNKASTVRNCIALNKSVATANNSDKDGEDGRVLGLNGDSGTISNNYAWDGIGLYYNTSTPKANKNVGANAIGGASITSQQVMSQSSWTTAGFNFNSNPWRWDCDNTSCNREHMPHLFDVDLWYWPMTPGGGGTSSDPFEVYDVETLKRVGSGYADGSSVWSLDAHYIQTADINMSGQTFMPIGSQAAPFTGTYNGGGYSISNLTVGDTAKDYQGMFGYLNSVNNNDYTLKNIMLVNVKVTGRYYVGGLVGYINSSKVQNCGTVSSKIIGVKDVGGIAGYNGGTLERCSSAGTISDAQSNAGGITGTNSGKVSYCDSATGLSNSTGENIGGVVGYNASNGEISNCRNTERINVDGNASNKGGIVGLNESNAIVENCQAIATVSDGSCSGGVAGYNKGTIKNSCHTNGTIGGRRRVGGVAGQNDGKVEQCYSYATISASGAKNVISYEYWGTYGGGVVGYNRGTVNDCYYSGSVKITYIYAGGIVGYNAERATVEYCYARGVVSGSFSIGGAVGMNHGKVNACVALNDEIETDFWADAGRLVGNNNDGSLSSLYARKGLPIYTSYVRWLGGKALTIFQKGTDKKEGKDVSSGTKSDQYNSWAFWNGIRFNGGIWQMTEGSLPTLRNVGVKTATSTFMTAFALGEDLDDSIAENLAEIYTVATVGSGVVTVTIEGGYPMLIPDDEGDIRRKS